MLSCAVQCDHGVVLCCAVLCSSVLCGALLCCAVQFSAVHCPAVQHGALWYSTVLHSASPCCAVIVMCLAAYAVTKGGTVLKSA